MRKRHIPKIVRTTRDAIIVSVPGKKRQIRVSKKKLPVALVTVGKRAGTIVSVTADRKRRALPAGWRISKSGRLYFENRRNRSDKKRI